MNDAAVVPPVLTRVTQMLAVVGGADSLWMPDPAPAAASLHVLSRGRAILRWRARDESKRPVPVARREVRRAAVEGHAAAELDRRARAADAPACPEYAKQVPEVVLRAASMVALLRAVKKV